MRKIRGFRVEPKESELSRRLRKKVPDLSLPEGELRRMIQEEQSRWHPALLYDSFSCAHPDHAKMAPLAPLPELPYTVSVITLGPTRPSEEIPPNLSRLTPILFEIALEEAARFALRIISDEADQDQWELSPPHPLTQPQALQILLKGLDLPRIDVNWSQESGWTPPATSAFAVSWLRPSKSKSRP